MKILYLGTAAAEGIPALFCECECCRRARNLGSAGVHTRSGAIVDGLIKLDFGPDSYKQMLDNALSYAKLHTLLITHSHEDHLDVDEINLRRDVFAHILSSDEPMTVYGNERVGEKLKGKLSRLLDFSEVKAFETFSAEGYHITPLEAVHCLSNESAAYPVTCEGNVYYRSEQAFIYLIEKDGKALLYAHDTDRLTPNDMEFLKHKKVDLISLDCTNGVLDVNYIGHMGIKENLEMRKRLLDAGCANEKTIFVANHFSHNGYTDCEDMQKRLPDFIVARDGLEIEF